VTSQLDRGFKSRPWHQYGKYRNLTKTQFSAETEVNLFFKELT